MPIIEYECVDCGHKFDFYSQGDKPELCPQCGGKTLKQLVSGFRFKMGHDYPKWVDRMDDYQKRQKDMGIEPTLPRPDEIM